MVSNYLINLEVDTLNNYIKVETEIKFNKMVKSAEFLLNNNLEIRNISSNRKTIEYIVKKDYNSIFLPECQKITVTMPEGRDSITVVYGGQVNGWQNIISDSYVALSLYSAWYPIIEELITESIKKNVTIKGLGDFSVIKGIKKGKNWLYECNDFDCNITAGKAWYVTSTIGFTPDVNVYTFNDKNIQNADEVKENFQSIITFYNEILGIKPDYEGNFDIVIAGNDDGGYCRDGFILMDSISEHTLAHECAHIWAKGAKAKSWEDWLNETFAETLALAYLEAEYGSERYDKYITIIKESALKAPAIRTQDGSRPEEGVHDKGTYLMYLLKEKFGKDTLIEIIKLFVKLKEKTTENLLLSIKKNISEDAACFIKDNLGKQNSEV